MTQHQQNRQQLWINVAAAVAGAENTRNSDAPGRWADQALADFDRTFSSDAAEMNRKEQHAREVEASKRRIEEIREMAILSAIGIRPSTNNPLTPEDMLDLQRIALERAAEQERERKAGTAPTCQTCRYFDEARSACLDPQQQFRSQTTRPTWSCPEHEPTKPAGQ